jgi:hypothetical protein
MSYDDVLAKFIWTGKRLMEAPKGSTEREEWTRILRELEGMKRATAATVTA